MLKADGTYIKEINKIEKHDLLILDDFGLQKLDRYSRMALLENYGRPICRKINHHKFTIAC